MHFRLVKYFVPHLYIELSKFLIVVHQVAKLFSSDNDFALLPKIFFVLDRVRQWKVSLFVEEQVSLSFNNFAALEICFE